MPKLNGLQLKEVVANLRPTVRFLLISGYAEDVVEDPTILETDTNFLEKPFLPDELIRRVRQLLRGKDGGSSSAKSAASGDVGT
jgi:two-component SAPR family response regulator